MLGLRLAMVLILAGAMAAVLAILLKYLRHLGTTAKAQDQSMRWSTQMKPTIGGIAFAMGFFGFIVFKDIPYFNFEQKEIGYAIAGLVAFGLGLWDDLKRLSASQKFLLQFLAAGIFVLAGFQLHFTGVFAIDLALTFIFTVGIMNSVNMLDNMDGISAVSVLPVFIVAFIEGPAVSLALIMMASLLAFLWFNAPRSKIFMGDSGSMLLGLCIAGTLCLKADGWSAAEHIAGWQLVAWLMLLLALPLADTTLVCIQRLRHGVSPAQGGRDHSTHNFVYLGYSEKRVFLLYLFLALFQASLVIFLQATDALLLFIIAIVYFLAILAVFFLISFRNLKMKKYSYPSK